MKILIACEFSGIVRNAFIDKGHDVISCDLLDSESPGPHYRGDVFDLKLNSFDMLIAFPPCTYLSNSGVRWLHTEHGRWKLMEHAAEFFRNLLQAGIDRIAIENPIMHGYAIDIIGRKQDQIIHPWEYGHGETKATCLWLQNLPKLIPTNIVSGRTPRVHYIAPGKNRWKERSRTLQGIASAMGDQWGELI